jgi:ABC-2 type transport system permease protein
MATASLWRYSAFTLQSMRAQMVYKERLLMWLFMVCMRIAALLFFWNIVYQGTHTIAGYSRGAMFTYVCITSALLFLFAGLLDRKVVQSIVDGSIAMDLIRPVDLYTSSLFSYLGEVLFQLLTFVPVMVLAGVLFFGVRGPHSIAAGLLFSASVALGIGLWHSIRWLFSLLVFWTETARGLYMLLGYIVQFLSGGLLPLSFFPPLMTRLLYLLPFQAVVYTPTGIFTGAIAVTDGVRLVILEAFWLVALFLASRFCWQRALRVLSIQGG